MSGSLLWTNAQSADSGKKSYVTAVNVYGPLFLLMASIHFYSGDLTVSKKTTMDVRSVNFTSSVSFDQRARRPYGRLLKSS